jgi:aminomethyltransferase
MLYSPEGAKIYAPAGGSEIGHVTSGIPSPTLGKNIAMGYVQTGWHTKGTAVEVDVRNKLRTATLTPMPFVKPKYWRG